MDIAKLNQIKNNLENTTVSKKQILDVLKVADVKYPESVFTHLKNANVISRVARNQYRFQKEPILKAMVEAGEKEAYKEKKKYNDQYGVNKSTTSFSEDSPKVDIEKAAIELLKKKGYRVFKYVEV